MMERVGEVDDVMMNFVSEVAVFWEILAEVWVNTMARRVLLPAQSAGSEMRMLQAVVGELVLLFAGLTESELMVQVAVFVSDLTSSEVLLFVLVEQC